MCWCWSDRWIAGRTGCFRSSDSRTGPERGFRTCRSRGLARKLAEAILANLFATETVALTKEDGIALHRVIGDEVRTRDAWELVRDTRRLSAEDRYKRLADWVLPGEGHPHIRFRGGHAPADEVRLSGPVAALPKGAVELEPSYGGGESVFPVIELVATARELRRMNELVQRWTNAPESTPEEIRAKDALGRSWRSRTGDGMTWSRA